MRRGLYRTACLAIICALALALSIPAMTATAAGNVRANEASVAMGYGGCEAVTGSNNDQSAWRSLFNQPAVTKECRSSPATVLIARDRLTGVDAAGSVATAASDTHTSPETY